MRRFLIHATITGATHNFYNVKGDVASDKDEVVFHPKAKNVSNAVRAAHTIARLAGCKIYQVKGVEVID